MFANILICVFLIFVPTNAAPSYRLDWYHGGKRFAKGSCVFKTYNQAKLEAEASEILYPEYKIYPKSCSAK